MHVHRLRVSLSRTLRILSASQRFLPAQEKGRQPALMPAAGMAGQVTHPRAGPAARADRSPRLRRRCEPPRGTLRPPSRRVGQAAQAYREGIRSALGVRTDPVWLKFPATLPSSKSRDLNPLADHPDTPYGPVCVPRPGKPARDFIARREHILGGGGETGKPASRSRILHLSPAMPMVTPLSSRSR